MSDSAGSIFIADLLATLPREAHSAARQVLRRHAGTVMHLPHTVKREEQRAYLETLMHAGLSKAEMVDRIVTCYCVTKRSAYRQIRAMKKP